MTLSNNSTAIKNWLCLTSVIIAWSEKKPKGKEVFEMNTTKTVMQHASKELGNMPEKKFRAGAVSATVWRNKGKSSQGEEVSYKTISLERSYTDKQGQWQATNTLRVGDLPKAAVVLQRAYEYLVLNEQDLFKGGN